MTIQKDILIGGAGIAGLASAALLAADGHRVLVLDKAPAPAPVGSGLVIQPVGLAVLDRIGVRSRIETLGAPLTRLFGISEPSGRVVLDARYDLTGGTRHGLGIQRRALFEVLLDAALSAGADVRFGTEIQAVDPKKGLATLTSGERLDADLVVDALGARSVLCPVPGRALSYGALWGNFEWPEGVFSRSQLEQRYQRASKMAGVLPLGTSPTDPTDRAAYFWSIRADKMADWRAASIDRWKDEALSLWPETAPILAHISSHDDLIEARYVHRTLSNPVSGRLVHIGDSWHATSPQLGQGANMALLDAAAFAVALSRGAYLEEALRDFHARRRWHLALYQAASRVFTPVYQSDSRALPVLRDQILSRVSYGWPVSALISGMIAGTMIDPLIQLDLD